MAKGQADGKGSRSGRILILSLSIFVIGLAWIAKSISESRNQSTLLDQLLEPFPSEYAICSSPQSSRWSSFWQVSVDQLPSWSSFSSKSQRIHTLAGSGAGSEECLIIKDGKTLATGPRSIVDQWCSKISCDVRTLPKGYTIQPAFIDAHGHLLSLGQSIYTVDLTNSHSLQECISRVEAFLLANPKLLEDEDAWIEGNGWDHTRWYDWDGSKFPTMADLSDRSKLLANRKISLKRIDFHALWLSRRAMDEAMAHHKKKTDNDEIDGGLIVRDPQTGQSTGILIDNAMQLALDVIPPWTHQNRKDYLSAASDLLLSKGITGVGDAAASVEDLVFLDTAQRQGSLKIRVYAFLACPTGQFYCLDEAKRSLPGLSLPFKNEDASSMLSIRTVKLFADGALGSWGSALHEPYSDRPDTSGLLLLHETQLADIVDYWSKAGWQVATHAIGDRANTVVLDTYEKVLLAAANQTISLRPRIEHAQLLRPSEFTRFSHLDVIASVQPTHCTSDFYYVEKRIGPNRLYGAYAWQSLIDRNASLIFGSDFPVESPDVQEGIWAATSRLDKEGQSPLGEGIAWFPEERVSRLKAIKGFSKDVAYGQFQEKVLGSLEKDKWADWILVKGDLVDEGEDVRKGEIVGTVVNGQWAWQRAVASK